MIFPFKRTSALLFILLTELIIGNMCMAGQNVQKAGAADSLKINPELTDIREISHFLTDSDIQTWNKWIIPKRKKAFVRYVKQLNEKIESRFFTEDSNPEMFQQNLRLLRWIHSSFRDKIIRNNRTKITWRQKISMWRHTRKSKHIVVSEDSPAQRKNEDVFLNSVFELVYPDSIAPEKRFSFLARTKKIKIKDHMILIFDKCSMDGSAPKAEAFATDYDNSWVIKWGDEIHSDIAGSRIFSALGYDVDHPYFFGKNKVTLIFNEWSELKDKNQLIKSVMEKYEVDITPYISQFGTVNDSMILENKNLKKFRGKNYMRFVKCSIEARPDRVKRIGSFLPDEFSHINVLRESLLAHYFIGNWDTREENTLLTTVHQGKHQYGLSPVFSDLGTSFGVKRNYFPVDFKTGLVNEFGWEVVRRNKNKVYLIGEINSILKPFLEADYADLKKMALKISRLDEKFLRQIVKKAHWPQPVAELYFHKLASRRKSILDAFGITDPHPIPFDRNLTIEENGIIIVKEGKLVADYDRKNNPESFYHGKGRFRNYGN